MRLYDYFGRLVYLTRGGVSLEFITSVYDIYMVKLCIYGIYPPYVACEVY